MADARVTRAVAPLDFYLVAVMALASAVGAVGSPRFRDRVAAVVAALAFRLSHAKRRGSEATLARVFGRRLSAHRRRTIVRAAFREFWRDKLSLLPSGEERVRVVGEEHLRRALAHGRGAILWISNNYAGTTTLERILHARGLPVYKVHAARHLGGFRIDGESDTWFQRRVVTPFFEAHERRVVAGIVHVTEGSLAFVRALAATLAANGVVCVSGDARVGRRFVALPFLGIPEAFPTGVVTLAASSRAPLLPTFCERRRLVIEPPLAVPERLDRDRGVREVLARWVARLEHHARRHPSRYFNWHLVGVGLPSGREPS